MVDSNRSPYSPANDRKCVIQGHCTELGLKARGFGSATTGAGYGAQTMFIQNTNDSGVGSLREALETDGPRYIKFKDGLHGTIKLARSIEVKSNKTLDALGHNITVSPENPKNT